MDWGTISKPHDFGGWNIENIEWFGQSLRLKSLWMVLEGRGIWSCIIGYKYLKNLFVMNGCVNNTFLYMAHPTSGMVSLDNSLGLQDN